MTRRKLFISSIAAIFAVGLAKAAQAFSIASQSIIYWGYNNVQRSTMWVGPDGSIGVRGDIPNERSAFVLMPTMNGNVARGAKSELVLYRTTDGKAGQPEQNWERFSISAMNDAEPMLRFSGECGGSGEFREFWFGYDNFYPGVAYFPLRVTPKGVFVADISGNLTRIGG